MSLELVEFKAYVTNSGVDFDSLSNEEKQLLLDKLFNLEVINILNGILKDLNKNNKLRM
jgi:hypothetical protein